MKHDDAQKGRSQLKEFRVLFLWWHNFQFQNGVHRLNLEFVSFRMIYNLSTLDQVKNGI